MQPSEPCFHARHIEHCQGAGPSHVSVAKTLPTVVASPARDLGLAVLEFQEPHPIANRDATGYYYKVRLTPDARYTRVAVLFSGTVFYVNTDAFGLPSIPDKQTRFTVFAEAAIGDYVVEHGLPESTPSGTAAAQIECFSPHFQTWQDRAPATDDQIEAYLKAHLLWSWKFAQKGWELGLPDCLRLHRPFEFINRIVALGEGKEWTAQPREPYGQWLIPTPEFLRRERDGKRSTNISQASPPMNATPATSGPPEYVYVDETRIGDLRRSSSTKFDLRKLIALCEELNIAYRSQCYHAVAALNRALLDHVPPILGFRTFVEVANNYGGTKSVRECLKRLEESARDIADMHLHTAIRAKEALPSRTQVNFSNDIDVLLAEIVRLL
jgi:hypothetical protein